jgi:DNA-binding CsgD family transcriptional regulator
MQAFTIEVGVDGQDRILSWGTEAQGLFGYPAAEILGLRLQDVLDGRDVFGNRLCHGGCWLRDTFQSGEPVRRFEIEVRHAAGRRIRVIVNAETTGAAGWTYRFLPDRRRSAAPRGEPRTETTAAGPRPGLTQRQLVVLRLLARGAETTEIANELGISATTVRNHVQHVLDKLGAHNRLQAVSFARLHGLL